MEQIEIAKDLSEYNDATYTHLIKIILYTPISLCFSIEDTSSKPKIIDTLKKGLKLLSASFPWLAGQVIREPVEGSSVTISKIMPLQDSIRLIIKDYTDDDDIPPMKALREAKFPCSMLDGEKLTSLTGPPTIRPGDLAPVFFVQANLIKGGLILSCAGEHSTMDGQGTGQVMRLLSKACHGEPFTEDELVQGNRIRNGIIPLLDQSTFEPGPELDHLIVKPTPSSGLDLEGPPPAAVWANFHFPASSLSKLKSLAASSRSMTDNPTVRYTTTNDALSAFVWQIVSRVRSTRAPPNRTTVFGRAVDVRAALSVPPTYLGNMSNHTYTTLPISSVPTTPLGTLAAILRAALDPKDLAYGMQSLATQIATTEDTSSISYGAGMDFSYDVFFSSWAGLPCYDMDFNLGLGYPESVRRANFLPIEGLMYLLSMDRQGGIDLVISLREEDMEKLRTDKDFLEYAEYIG